MTAPLTRRNITFVILKQNPEWMERDIHEHDTFTATVELFGLKREIKLTGDEFNVYRATFLLMELQDNTKWFAFVADLMFPSDQELEPGLFSV